MRLRSGRHVIGLLLTAPACNAADPVSPSPALIATWDGVGGVIGGPTYTMALSIREVSDSVRGNWRLVYDGNREPDDGTFAGAAEGDQLVLRLLQSDCAGELILRIRLLRPDALGTSTFSTLGGCDGPGGGVDTWVRHQLRQEVVGDALHDPAA